MGEKIDINGSGIYYEKFGTGSQPILILPGGTGSIDTDIRQLIDAMSKTKYTIIGMDPLGYGKSRPPARDYKLGVGLYKRDADISVELMRRLGYNSFNMMGWSDGGRVGLVTAIHYPGAIERLVTWGSAPCVTKRQQLALESSKNLDVWDRNRKEDFFRVYGEEDARQLWARHVDYYKTLSNICKDRIHEIQCPTLILHGDRDPVEKSLALEMSQKIPDSQFHSWPDGGHDIHVHHLKEFVKIVETFLDD